MESSLEERDNNDNKLTGEDNTRRDNINGYLDFIESSEQESSIQKASESNSEQNVNTSSRKRIVSPTKVEKGQQEVESRVKELSLDAPLDNEGNIDTDEYNFSEDQKRAMMELLTQTEEDDDFIDEEPPEYNVKGRLIQLNEDLANDPAPLEADREHKVGFKPKIVDLVAPPPADYSDDEHHSSSITPDINSTVATSTMNQKKSENSFSNEDVNNSKENIADPNKKQYVVEQDGQFYLVSANDLKSTGMDMDKDGSEKKANKQSENQYTKGKINSYNNQGEGDRAGELSGTSKHNSPKPPSEPRPKSGASRTMESLHPSQSPLPRSAGQSPQPRSAGQSPQRRSIGQISNSSSCLINFTYSSPYAMTSEQKAIAREEARQMENERKEKEKRHKLEEEERRSESNSAYHAWLDKKKEQEKQRQESENQNKKSEQREENKNAFKVWLKEKTTQVKQEKLLKRRQQQEQNDWFFLRTREECEKAFKEWIRDKNIEKKKKHQMELQRNKLYRIQVKHSKKTLALIRALKETQAFRYAEYYGYRF